MSNPKSEIIEDITPNIPSKPGQYLLYAIKPFRLWAMVPVILVILASLIDISSSYLFKLIVDAIEADDFDSALIFVLLFPVVTLVVQLLYRSSGVAGARLSSRVMKHNFDSLTDHALKHSHSYFINRFAGSLMSKVQNIVDATESIIHDVLWGHLNAFITLSTTLIFIMFIDWQSGLVFLGLIIVLILLNRKLSVGKMKLSTASAESATKLRGRLVDIFGNVQAVRQYARERDEYFGVRGLSRDHQKIYIKSWDYSERTRLINGLVLFVFSVTMFWFLITGWKQDEVSTGELVLVLGLYTQITGLLVFIGQAFDRTARAVGQIREGLQELAVPFDVMDAPDAKPLLTDLAEIEWKNVNFKFDTQSVFNDFCLTIPAGQRLGLVGQSGAGKTTFVSLLLRQHELSAGAIEIDGQDISRVTQESLRQAIAVVPQEPALFHRTIRENILYGNPHATEEEMIAVAQKAQAHDFISALPLGYDTLVGERGVKLSGGQKQRVAIARAMLKDAPILVLDEATSALDSESEVAIQRALEALMEGRTVIAIAHRLSTLRKMDRIIVLENGQVIEDGSHDSLSLGGGVYERLWKHQAGGFLQDD